MISHVKFISIPTADQDRALTFWTEVVGFRVLTDQPFDEQQRWIELRIGSSDTKIVLFMFGEQGLNLDRSPGPWRVRTSRRRITSSSHEACSS